MQVGQGCLMELFPAHHGLGVVERDGRADPLHHHGRDLVVVAQQLGPETSYLDADLVDLGLCHRTTVT
jgi:hypothetical protein